MNTVTLTTPTVHCRSCKLTIEESLNELHGIASSDVDVDDHTVTVTYDADVVDTPAITATIEAAGYPVES